MRSLVRARSRTGTDSVSKWYELTLVHAGWQCAHEARPFAPHQVTRLSMLFSLTALGRARGRCSRSNLRLLRRASRDTVAPDEESFVCPKRRRGAMLVCRGGSWDGPRLNFNFWRNFLAWKFNRHSLWEWGGLSTFTEPPFAPFGLHAPFG